MPRTKLPAKSKRATSQLPAGKPAAGVSRRAAALRVPEGKAAAALLQQARLSPEALRDYSAPPPAKTMLRTEARLHARPAGPITPVRLRKAFDAARFARILAGRLDAQGVGYAFQLNQGGSHKLSGQRGWARHAADGRVGWDPDTRMHIASASKFYTAAALLHVLGRRGIAVEARVRDHLPAHWVIGNKARWLTFQSILTHVAGLYTGDCAYDAIKREIAQAQQGIGEGWHYANGNYALMRLLVPILDGTLQRDVDYGKLLFPVRVANGNDIAWDVLSRKHFHDYLQTHLWRPAGVNFASLRSTRPLWNLPPLANMPHVRNAAIGYRYPPVASNARGADISEDLTAAAGAVGWHVSCREMLAAAGRLRRGGQMLASATVESMLDSHYGIFGTHTNDHGEVRYHDGMWSGSDVSEWSYLGFIGRTYELAVLSNNARDSAGKPSLGLLRDLVHGAYDESFS